MLCFSQLRFRILNDIHASTKWHRLTTAKNDTTFILLNTLNPVEPNCVHPAWTVFLCFAMIFLFFSFIRLRACRAVYAIVAHRQTKKTFHRINPLSSYKLLILIMFLLKRNLFLCYLHTDLQHRFVFKLTTGMRVFCPHSTVTRLARKRNVCVDVFRAKFF